MQTRLCFFESPGDGYGHMGDRMGSEGMTIKPSLHRFSFPTCSAVHDADTSDGLGPRESEVSYHGFWAKQLAMAM